ncbi:MAG: COR domain-containing protein [Methyloligellaceae bacterium]
MRDKDLQKEPDQRKNRTIAYQKFCDICKKTGGVSNPDVLLGYLHDTGIIFYQKDMFGNKIILDQQWALEAIYAVLDRDATYNIIKQRNGRFTRSDLGHFLWNKKYSEEEQELFLQMMISCGVCFIHQPGDEKNNVEAAYIAPDLLPEKPDPLAISAWC